MEDVKKVQILKQFHNIQILMSNVTFQGLKSHSPYRGQGRVLSILKENPQISQKELTENMDISKQALASLLKRMENIGYIVRETSEIDKRRQIIHLTPTGMAAADNSDTGSNSLISLLDCLDDEQQDILLELLAKITASNSHNLSTEKQKSIDEGIPCSHCTSLETCTHDYRKYGHDKPNPEHCRFLREALAKGAQDDPERSITESIS